MNKGGIVWALLLLVIAIGSNWITEQKKESTKVAYLQPVDIPFKYNESRQMVVEAQLNGHSINMVFDTGSPTMQLTRSTYNKLRKAGILKAPYRRDAFIDANGGVKNKDIVLIESVKLGNMAAHNVPCTIADSEEAPVLFGLDAIKQYGQLNIDYKNKTISNLQ